MNQALRKLMTTSWLAGVLGLAGSGCALAETLTVGPFTVEAVQRKIGAGGFPNTSGNPFKRVAVTGYRVLHKGKPVPLPGTAPDRAAPWWEARVLSAAPQPALLLMESGAVLLTEVDGQPRLQELAPRGSPRTEWQWLDAQQGQPGPPEIVGPADRQGQPRELSGGRWMAVYAQAVLDVRTLAIHRYTLNSTAVLDQLQRFYAADRPMLAFSPGGTQFVVAGERDRPGEPDPLKRFEHALVAFDFARQRGTVLPIALSTWRLQGPQDIDAAFARKALAWRRGPDGREQASLRQDLPALWQGKLTGREMDALSFNLQPVQPSMRAALAQFLERDFKAAIVPAATGNGMDVRIGELTLSLDFLRPQEQRLSLYYASDWQRKAQAHALIERIAERFNARLAAGEDQQHFEQAPRR
jgi:hypothetical protein